MRNYLRVRRIRKTAKDVVRQSKYLRNMRGDLMDQTTLARLVDGEALLNNALKSCCIAEIESAADNLYGILNSIEPNKSHNNAFRENIEILVVAIVVALSFRAYFLQPFKIPTGSMQPTLYGITSQPQDGRRFGDYIPMNLIKWFITGERYKEIRASVAGQIIDTPDTRNSMPSFCVVGNRRHIIPRYAELRVRNGDYVNKGDLLWSGIVKAGDHVFVDKLSWNFRKPSRGQIMVFSTVNIHDLPQGTFYIKRLIGLPNDNVSIDPPNVRINGCVVTEGPIFEISRKEPGYQCAAILSSPDKRISLASDEYFVLGDNTMNSRDSRYWGVVPQENIVGPAFCVYWPISRWPLFRFVGSRGN